MSYNLTDPYEIARYIKEAKKSTPIKAYIEGDLSNCDFKNIEKFNSGNLYILFGESEAILAIIEENKRKNKKIVE